MQYATAEIRRKKKDGEERKTETTGVKYNIFNFIRRNKNDSSKTIIKRKKQAKQHKSE